MPELYSHPMAEPCYRPAAEVVARRLGQAGVLVHLSTNQIFELNETGMRIWDLVGEGLPTDRIPARLTSEFSVGEAEALADVRTLLRELAVAGLVVAEPR